MAMSPQRVGRRRGSRSGTGSAFCCQHQTFLDRKQKGTGRKGNVPRRPLANTTSVGLLTMRKALKRDWRFWRMRQAMASPRPKPRREPSVACVETLEAALRSRARSSGCRSCCMCCSPRSARSLLGWPRKIANIVISFCYWLCSI